MDLLFLALIAGFIAYKLFIALGDSKYSEYENEESREAFEEFKRKIVETTDQDNTHNTLPKVPVDNAWKADIEKILKADPSFSLEKFIAGSHKAFEIIMAAFSEGDKTTLKHLLSSEVYTNFVESITKFDANSQELCITIVGITGIKIENVEFTSDKIVNITLNINSDQIIYVKDKTSDQLISGSQTRVKNKNDIWTFSKDFKTGSKIWKLTEVNA